MDFKGYPRILVFTGFVVIVLVLASTGRGSANEQGPLPSHPASSPAGSLFPSPVSNSTTLSSDPPGPVINEVMPLNPTGETQWVELYNPDFLLFLPIVNRQGGGAPAAVLAPARPNPPVHYLSDLSGWQLIDKDGETYTI